MKILVLLSFLGLCSAAPALLEETSFAGAPLLQNPIGAPAPLPTQTPHFVPAPAGEIIFGVDAEGCTVGPSGKVCPSGPVQFTSGAQGVPQPDPPRPAAPIHPPSHHHQQHAHHHAQFTGLVGPSGVIGPSGLVGPAGPVAFGK